MPFGHRVGECTISEMFICIGNMYFHGVKSTAHPPIMGTLGQGTDFIEKRPNTEVINIYLHSCQHFVSCWMSNSGLKQKLHLSSKLALENVMFVHHVFFSYVPRCHQVATKQLPSGHQLETKWSPSGPLTMMTKTFLPKKFKPSQVVTMWSPCGHQVVTKWLPFGDLTTPFGDPSRPIGDPTRPLGDLTTPFGDPTR